jgi:hypothetical protein
MFSKKLSALLALAFCATHAAANSMKTVDASDYALESYNAAVNKPLQVKPNTVYTVDKGSDTVEVDYSIIIQCPQPKKKGRMMKRGFITYLSFYDGYDEGGLEVYEAGSDAVQGIMYSATGDPGYGSLLPMFCTNGKLTLGVNGVIPTGTFTGDYLYWNASTSDWTVGSTAVNLGADTVAGLESVAVGYRGTCDVVWYLVVCLLPREMIGRGTYS